MLHLIGLLVVLYVAFLILCSMWDLVVVLAKLALGLGVAAFVCLMLYVLVAGH